MNFPISDDRQANAAFVLVELGMVHGRELVECSQQVPLTTAGGRGEFADRFGMLLCDQTKESARLLA